MIPALAQVSADQIHPLVQFIIGGSAAVFLLNQAITFWKEHMREKPIPGETYATLAAVKEMDRQAHGRMNRERDAAANALAAAEARMQAECKRIAEEVGTFNANGEDRVRRINERIDELRDEVANAPAATVRLLRETKGLLG